MTHWFKKQLQLKSTICLNLGAEKDKVNYITSCNSSPGHREAKMEENNCNRQSTRQHLTMFLRLTVGTA